MGQAKPNIFSDFLKALGVPHTVEGAESAFKSMPFQSLFGFARLLGSYGVKTRGVKVTDKSRLAEIPVPFVAQEGNYFVIVDEVGPSSVVYTAFHKRYTRSLDDFMARWSGIALLAYPDDGSREPCYARNRFMEIVEATKKWALAAMALLLFVFGFIYSGLWRNLSTILLMAVDLAGTGVTWLLLLKTLKVKSVSADAICGVLQKHGCDTVLEQKASSFFGIFKWSEVGITYFGLTTLLTLVYPQYLPWLALFNCCCLPFTFWSIWYQKFRIRTWCTLCVTTQGLLWLQFFCYLPMQWWRDILPLSMPVWLMAAAYIAVLLAVSRVVTFILKRSENA